MNPGYISEASSSLHHLWTDNHVQSEPISDFSNKMSEEQKDQKKISGAPRVKNTHFLNWKWPSRLADWNKTEGSETISSLS